MVLSNRRLCECIVIVALLIMGFRNFADPDGWWHLRTGQLIVATGSVPHTDTYSANHAGKKWVAHEWLSEVLMYLGYELGGIDLLMAGFAIIAAAAFWITHRRSAGRPYIAAISVVLGMAVASPVLGVRPQIFSVLFTSIFLAVLEKQASTKESRGLWWLVPLMVVWVNLHGAFVIGLALIGCYTAGLLLDGWLIEGAVQPVLPKVRQFGLTLIACVLVVPLNPNGLTLILYPLQTMKLKAASMYITEWASPNFHQPFFQALAVFMLLTFVLAALSKRKPRPSALLLLSATAFGALYSARHIPIFTLVAIPQFAQSLSDFLQRFQWTHALSGNERTIGTRQQVLNLTLLLIVVSVGLVRIGSTMSDQDTIEAKEFPKSAVQFIREHHITGSIYNLYEWGGYITWHLFPSCRANVDGRADIYGDQFMTDYMNSYFGGKGWKEPIDRSGAQTALVSPNAPVANLLREQQNWKNVFEDDIAVVFVHE